MQVEQAEKELGRAAFRLALAAPGPYWPTLLRALPPAVVGTIDGLWPGARHHPTDSQPPGHPAAELEPWVFIPDPALVETARQMCADVDALRFARLMERKRRKVSPGQANGVIMRRRHSESSGDRRSGPGSLAVAGDDVDIHAAHREARLPSGAAAGPQHWP